MADTNVPLPTLPAHIEETIQSIARLHAEHHNNATPLQRAVDRITALQPGMPPGTTCSPTSKDTTIVSGSIPPEDGFPPISVDILVLTLAQRLLGGFNVDPFRRIGDMSRDGKTN